VPADELDREQRRPSPNVSAGEHLRAALDAALPAAAPARGGRHVSADGFPRADGPRPDRSRSRFFRNLPRKISLVFVIVAFAALVIGGGFAEISSDGAPTPLETAVVRWVILGSLVVAAIAYVIGGRQQANRPG